MISFLEFLTEEKHYLLSESIRVGLPHITTMDHEQTANLVKGGQIHLHNITEKTDGTSGLLGYDAEGPYTQSTGSGAEKMRRPADYRRRVSEQAAKKGVEPNYTSADAFAKFHQAFSNNTALQNHLKSEYERTGKEVKVKGEIFHRAFEKPGATEEERKYVATSYNPRRFGRVAHFVIHSKLGENAGHDLDHFSRNLSNSDITFDNDIIEHPNVSVNVEQEAKEISGLDHSLLASRTKPTNKAAKLAEQEKLQKIQQRISSKVDSAISSLRIRPKWGSETEGMVVHPPAANPDAPRFKVTSAEFRAYRASDAANWKKK